MPRANPNQSFEVAAKHLFRHLRNPRVLRVNPLAANFFLPGVRGRRRATLDDVLASRTIWVAVAKAIEHCRVSDVATKNIELARRRYVIALRDLLAGAPAREVATELNISLRQYYRERRSISNALARSFVKVANESTERVTRSIHQPRTAAALKQRLRTFSEMGRPDLGADMVLGDLQKLSDPREIVDLLCEAAELQARGGLLSSAKRHFQEAVSVSECIDGNSTFGLWSRARCALAKAVLAMNEWDSPPWTETNTTVATARECATFDLDGRLLLFDALLARSAACLGIGKHGDAFDDLRVASSLTSNDQLSQSRRIDLHILSAKAAYYIGRFDMAFENAWRAARIANAVGYARSEALALAQVALLETFRGVHMRSLSLQKKILVSSRDVLTRDEWLEIYLTHVAITRQIGRVEYAKRAWNKIKDLTGNLTGNSLTVVRLLWYIDHAYFAMAARDYTNAIDLARNADALAERLGYPEARGTSLRIVAETLRAGNEIRNAKKFIADSVSILEKRGGVYSLEQSYWESAQITGNRRHAAAAKELLHSRLGLSG